MKCGFTITSYEDIISIDASSSGRNAECITYPQKGMSVTNKRKPIFVINSVQKLLDMSSCEGFLIIYII